VTRVNSSHAPKVAIVTGGSRGLGFEVVLALLQAGVKGITLVDLSGLEEAVASLTQYEDRILACTADCSREEDAKRYVDATMERFGQLDVRRTSRPYHAATFAADLVSNSRHQRRQSLHYGSGESSLRGDVWLKMCGSPSMTSTRSWPSTSGAPSWASNTRPKPCWPLLPKAKVAPLPSAPQTWYAALPSAPPLELAQGHTAWPDYSGYVASKFAVRGLAGTAAQELGVHGIRCNAVSYVPSASGAHLTKANSPGAFLTDSTSLPLLPSADSLFCSDQEVPAQQRRRGGAAAVAHPVRPAGRAERVRGHVPLPRFRPRVVRVGHDVG
jgi:NAD(P)-dependent dehydrogenase (short-subunit alcohol dehydrogenase family)